MNRFLIKLREFFYGRNGLDRFGGALFIFYVIVSCVCSFFASVVVRLLPLLPLGYFIFRALSRNLEARRRENAWYCRVFGPAGDKLRAFFARLADTTHKYYRCPECRRRVRVPKFRGKIEIRCPLCGHRFVKDTGR